MRTFAGIIGDRSRSGMDERPATGGSNPIGLEARGRLSTVPRGEAPLLAVEDRPSWCQITVSDRLRREWVVPTVKGAEGRPPYLVPWSEGRV